MSENNLEIPPQNSEDEITEPARVRWLLTRYLVRPPIAIRAPYAKFDGLYCEPNGTVWAVVMPDFPKTPYLLRCKERLIGDDNLTVEQPLVMLK